MKHTRKHISRIVAALLLCFFSAAFFFVSAVSYNGTATPLMETTTGEY